jgi:formate dehydrogenase
VVIDPAFTETARFADYVLGVPCGYEKWEFAAFPKRYPQIDVQLRPPVIPAPSGALPEPEIYTRLAERMGLVESVDDELRALAGPETAEARAAFLMTAMSRLPALAKKGRNGESQLLFWAYRAMGHHFPAPSLVAMWAQAQANAMEGREAVLRTLGPQWAEKSPLEIGEEIMRRILTHPEGVEIACIDPAANFADHIGYRDGRVRLAPEPMLAEMERALASRPIEDPDYPFVLASGLRTRWTANTVQRDPAWRKARGPHCELNLAPADAARLAIAKGDRVRIETRRGSIELPAMIDAKLQPGHCWMPNGFGVEYAATLEGVREVQGANCNEITDAADRDPFTGCPHHRVVRVRLQRVASSAAA